MDFLTSSMQTVSAFFSSNPSVFAVQSAMMAAAAGVVFLVLFATRDIMLRTHSFVYQVFCILIVAVLPVLGFLLYILIRPSRTLTERRLERKMDAVLQRLQPLQQQKKPQQGSDKQQNNQHHHHHHDKKPKN